MFHELIFAIEMEAYMGYDICAHDTSYLEAIDRQLWLRLWLR